MEEVCTVSEQTGEKMLRLPDCRCAPKFSLQPAFILYIACAKISLSDKKNYGFAFVLIIFLFYLPSSHFQLLNSTYISRPLSMCLSSQVKRQSPFKES